MKRFLIFDVDNTFSTFHDKAGMLALRMHLNRQIKHIDEGLARRICDFMERCYGAFQAKARGENSPDLAKFQDMLAKARHEVLGADGFDDLHWSRELWIYVAAAGSLSPRSCVDAAQDFWQDVARAAHEYNDAYNFFHWLYNPNYGHNWKASPPEDVWETVFVTSSDARLKASRDNLNLLYDPEYSRREKAKRINRVMWNSTVNFANRVFIGDPIGKPHPEFWQRVLNEIGYNREEDLAIMTGDSYRVDISGVSQFAIVPVLIDRNRKTKQEDVPEAKYLIGSLQELQAIMISEEKERLVM